MAIEKTKGYLKLRGEVYNLEKDPYENNSTKKQVVVVKTSEQNRIKTFLGNWKNSNYNIKFKCDGMDKPIEINEQEAIDEVKASFNEGDTAVIRCSLDVNTYKEGSLDFYVNNIYIADKKVDFAADDFKETAELYSDVIVTDKIKDGIQKVAFANHKEELLHKELVVTDKDIIEYLEENAEVGDVLKVYATMKYEPVYEEKQEESKPSENQRKTLKNRNVGGSSTSRGKIIGNKETIEIVDIDIEKTQSKKYTSDEIGGVTKSDGGDMPF